MWKRTIYVLVLPIVIISCIKEEALNKEADIERFEITDQGFISSLISEDNQTIKLVVEEDVDLSNLHPAIFVSEGATVTSASGISQNFTDGKIVLYKVTSEDGVYSKEYQVRAVHASTSLRYDFEEWEESGGLVKYPILSDTEWSSGNQGVSIATLGKIPEYPTHKTADSYSGEYALELKTIEGKPKLAPEVLIYSGSMFRGKFNANPGDPLKSLYLGHKLPQASGKPYKFEGYYKYKPGEVYRNSKDIIVPNKVDEFTAYSVIFKVSKGAAGNDEYLDGETILTSDKIIARADLTDTSAQDTYKKFSLKFKYTEEMNYDKYDYKMTIVFASSKNGDFYEGAIGSTLIVDQVEIVCTPF